MQNLISSPTGLVHLIFALLALVFGTAVLFMKKGTPVHKKAGYLYLISMLVMNATAFGIYRLFGGFGIFHYAALLSLFSLIGGIYPAYRRRSGWHLQHLEVMLWSVVGLYAAFAAEISVRFFSTTYFF
ncbi:MAG: DUF2306 domain-containing protein [Flavobacteriaceae bacterium]|nr:DUF2306 domain-containing protein [Flavobacteriaceae bacterium]